MKFDEIKEKSLALFKRVGSKIGKKTVIAASATLVIAIAVLLNFILWGSANDPTPTPGLDLSDLSKTVGETDQNADEAKSTFAEMVLSRTVARDESMEVLNGIINSDTAVEEMKTDARAELTQIAKDIEREANIETLVRSKGFKECVAVISGDSVNVIVDCDGITQAQVSQISEIVYEQAGIIPANLRIIEG